MAALKAKQDEIRRLMKERRENLKEQKNRVDSPFAKYNSLGQLSCKICSIQIKNSSLWVSHVAGKIHKENALKKRKGSCESPKIGNVINQQNDGKTSEFLPPTAKKLKVDTEVSKASKPEASKSREKLSSLNEYSSSEEDEESDAKSGVPISKNEPSSILPKDFFDAAAATVSTNNDSEKKNASEILPEGFFDDPVQDAKARNIEYKDPVEEEWEKYQKAIAEETNVSKNIIAEDLEESVLERDISQIDEQIMQWQKIKELESMVEEVKTQLPYKDEEMSLSGCSDDELDEDELLDWRTKNVSKR